MEIMERLADAYRRLRNTFRFLLGNLGDFDRRATASRTRGVDEVDRWILDRLARLHRSRARRVRGVRVPHRLPQRAQLLRGRPVLALSRRGQGIGSNNVAAPTIRADARRKRRATTSSRR